MTTQAFALMESNDPKLYLHCSGEPFCGVREVLFPVLWYVSDHPSRSLLPEVGTCQGLSLCGWCCLDRKSVV